MGICIHFADFARNRVPCGQVPLIRRHVLSLQNPFFVTTPVPEVSFSFTCPLLMI
jgi:hypothetical protein